MSKKDLIRVTRVAVKSSFIRERDVIQPDSEPFMFPAHKFTLRPNTTIDVSAINKKLADAGIGVVVDLAVQHSGPKGSSRSS